jgi:hypothetical protein
MPLVRSVRECGRGGGNMDLANGAFDDRCAGLRDLFRAPASTVPSKRARKMSDRPARYSLRLEQMVAR